MTHHKFFPITHTDYILVTICYKGKFSFVHFQKLADNMQTKNACQFVMPVVILYKYADLHYLYWLMSTSCEAWGNCTNKAWVMW